jgi:hypothetical protein
MTVAETLDMLAGEAIIFGLVWVFSSTGHTVFAGILFVTLHLIAHNGHVGFEDKREWQRKKHGHNHTHDRQRWKEEATDE